MNWVFVTNSVFQILITCQPVGVNCLESIKLSCKEIGIVKTVFEEKSIFFKNDLGPWQADICT